MVSYLDKANVKVISDGSVAGTKVVFIHEDGTEEPIIPVCAAEWALDVAQNGILTPILKLTIEMAAVELITPAALVEFIGVPHRETLLNEAADKRMKERYGNAN